MQEYMLKKTLIILACLFILIAIYAIWAFSIRFEVPEGFDLGHDTPPDLIREVYNPIFDDTVTFKKFSAETEGAYTLLEIDLGPGGGNIPHFHQRFTETFIPVKGTLGVEYEGEHFYLEPGEQITAHERETHRFFNPTDERIIFQVRIEPGSAGFEKALYLMYGLAQDGKMHEDGRFKEFNHTALFVKLSDTQAPGMINLIKPFIKRSARKMEESGEADSLLQKYYFSQTRTNKLQTD